MESQPQNPEFRNNPENVRPCKYSNLLCWPIYLTAIYTAQNI